MLEPLEEVVRLTTAVLLPAAVAFHCGERMKRLFEPFWSFVWEERRDACTRVTAVRIWHKDFNDMNMFGLKGNESQSRRNQTRQHEEMQLR